MDEEELKTLISSETVRKYVMETGWTFTDWEKAALLCHEHRRWKEESALLKALAERTQDEELRGQIAAWLEWHERALQAFQENGKKQCIYLLEVQEKGGMRDGEYLPHGYFFCWEEALAFGKKENAPFEIEKYRIGDVSVFDDGTCSHDAEGFIRFDEAGEICIIESYEIPHLLDSIKEMREHFSEMYFEVPNPFERGDVVKIRYGGYGIVGMSSKAWRERSERRKKDNYADYSDVVIGVDIFEEETGFFLPTDSISPLDLELYQPKDDLSAGTMDSLLWIAQYIYRENGYLGDFFYWLKKYYENERIILSSKAAMRQVSVPAGAGSHIGKSLPGVQDESLQNV